MNTKLILWSLFIGFLLISISIVEVQADFQSGFKAYRAGEYEMAYKELITEAELGNVDAQYYIGHMFWMGYGVDQSDKEAVKWFGKAAGQNHWLAKNFLRSKVELTKDEELPHNNSSESNYKVGLKAYQAGKYEVAYMSLIVEAAQLNEDAQYYIGHMFWYGLGVDADRQEAIKWLSEASVRGHWRAKEFLKVVKLHEGGELQSKASSFDTVNAPPSSLKGVELTEDGELQSKASSFNTANAPSSSMRTILYWIVAILLITLSFSVLPRSIFKLDHLKYIGVLFALLIASIVFYLYYLSRFQLEGHDLTHIYKISYLLSFLLFCSYAIFLSSLKLFKPVTKMGNISWILIAAYVLLSGFVPVHLILVSFFNLYIGNIYFLKLLAFLFLFGIPITGILFVSLSFAWFMGDNRVYLKNSYVLLTLTALLIVVCKLGVEITGLP